MRPFTLLPLLVPAMLFAQQDGPVDPLRSGPDPALEPFFHGVASGDPEADRVIIWTRVTSPLEEVEVLWRMALDTGMTQVVAEGLTTALATHDHTVKVDVGGLQPFTFYYYEFEALEARSVRGRTRTLPVGTGVDSLRFAVVSCSNYAAGYFNAYARITQRNDVFAVIHLGDYIYEYGSGQFGGERPLDPPVEILSLNDYRIRHSHYKLDPDLMRLHQQYPFFSVWDDHESANDSWYGGAQNHNAGEGDWFARKSAAIRAYAEWMPLRLPDPQDTLRIYRRFAFGDLMTLHMLDTRLVGRDEQSTFTNNDPDRQLLGADQFEWLAGGMSGNMARWQVLGQQVMVAPLLAFGVPVNQDQWDGYPAERQRVYDHVMQNNIRNMVVLTGDIHTTWANDLPYANYNPSSGAGSAGVEFVTTSITSTSFDLPIPSALIQILNPHMKYVNLSQRGYLVIDVNHQRVQGDRWFVPDVSQPNGQESFAGAHFTVDMSRHLMSAAGPSVASPAIIGVPAPLMPRPFLVTGLPQEIKPLLIGAYPNPFLDHIDLQLAIAERGPLTMRLLDGAGRIVLEQGFLVPQAGLHNLRIPAPGLASGAYLLHIVQGDRAVAHRMIKVDHGAR
ncbi:MAG: alkaline phosphatase D family protein [Flavobacteriales bacterium]|nr:alkaline phosphatase D family protein [Flavobacteriales bacterium]